MDKKPVEDSSCCSECEHLIFDRGAMRCDNYYRIRIDNPEDKQCEDSTQ